MSSETAIGLIIKSSMLLVAAFGILLSARRRSAATRHSLLLAAMLACAALPWLAPSSNYRRSIGRSLRRRRPTLRMERS